MALISSAAVASFLGIPDNPTALNPKIAMAEAIAAGAIGTESLSERAVHVERSLGGEDILYLDDGPLASLTSFTLGGSSVATAGLLVSYWTIRYPRPPYSSSSRQCFYGAGVLDYKAGWTDVNVPERLKQALIMLSAVVYQHPNPDIVAERIGDYSYQRAGSTQASTAKFPIPANIMLMLGIYTRPFVA